MHHLLYGVGEAVAVDMFLHLTNNDFERDCLPHLATSPFLLAIKIKKATASFLISSCTHDLIRIHTLMSCVFMGSLSQKEGLYSWQWML